jgi:hypothetical protein
MVGVNLEFPFSQQSLLVDASEVRPQGGRNVPSFAREHFFKWPLISQISGEGVPDSALMRINALGIDSQLTKFV